MAHVPSDPPGPPDSDPAAAPPHDGGTGPFNPVVRALRRSRSRWRTFAFLAIAIAVLAVGLRIGQDRFNADTDYVALVAIDGVITTNSARLDILQQLETDERAKAVILRINSPGGTTAGGEELYEAISALREHKPVVAVINELGASAAYMTAIAADRIIARRLSIVGSIGVLFNHVNAGGLLRTVGIDLEKVASGPLKAEPDTDEAMTPEVRASLQSLVDDSFNWFVDVVTERRKLSRERTLELADGRIVNGRVALQDGLIDAFGGQREAIDWLEKEREVATDLPVWQVYPQPLSFEERFVRILGQQAGSLLGLSGLAGKGETLDGLVSLWHL